MVVRIILFIVIALGSAGFGIVGWVGLHSAAPRAEASVSSPQHGRFVLAAAHDIAAGSLMKPEDVSSVEIDADDPRVGAWSDTPAGRSELVGAMVRRSLAPKDVVLPADVMRPGDHGFLAAVLGPGERAVSIGVDAVSGTAGLIWPGDHVDVILTQVLDAQNQPVGHRIVGETVLHNVRVIAIDQELVHGGANSSADKASNRTVTLSVTPEEATKVSVAMRLGKVSLVVVSADQSDASTDDATRKPPANTVTWGGDVSSALRQGPGGNGNTIRVFQGSTDSKEFKF
jgi:pilus assembly protein CpaB